MQSSLHGRCRVPYLECMDGAVSDNPSFLLWCLIVAFLFLILFLFLFCECNTHETHQSEIVLDNIDIQNAEGSKPASLARHNPLPRGQNKFLTRKQMFLLTTTYKTTELPQEMGKADLATPQVAIEGGAETTAEGQTIARAGYK